MYCHESCTPQNCELLKNGRLSDSKYKISANLWNLSAMKHAHLKKCEINVLQKFHVIIAAYPSLAHWAS